MNILDQNTIEQYLNNNPESTLFPILAEKLLLQRDLEEAEKLCQKGLKLHKKSADGYYILAKILLQQEKLPQAIKQLQNAIKYQPGFLMAHKLLLLLGKENLSLKEIDYSHKIIESFEIRIAKLPEATLSHHSEIAAIENDLISEEDFVEETDIDNDFQEEPFLENDDENNLDEGTDDSLDLSLEEDSDLDTDEALLSDIGDESTNNDEMDFELDLANFDDDSIKTKEKETAEEKLGDTPQDESENLLLDELDLDNMEDDIPNDELELDNSIDDETPPILDDFNLSIDDFELDLNDEEIDSTIENLSIRDEKLDIDDNIDRSTSTFLSNFDFNDNELPDLADKNITSNLSIQPVEEEVNTELTEDIPTKENPSDESPTEEEIPEFKSNMKQSIEATSKEESKDKINLNIPIPTLTFVEVLKKQKLYDQALEILEILEKRSSDKDKIIQEKEEIIRLKVQDNY